MLRTLILIISLLFIWSCSTVQNATESIPVVALDTVEVDSDNIYHQYRGAEKRIVDLLHTKLEVSFDWDSTFLYGKATLDFRPYFYPTDSILIDAKGFKINEIALLDQLGRKTALDFTYDSLVLKIDLKNTYTKNDTLTLFINYVAMPNKLASGGSAAITNDIGLYFINPSGEDIEKPQQIWTQGETEASSCWFPTIDAPNERCSQEMYITVDTNFKSLSNGELIFQTDNGDGTRTDYWKQSLPHAPYLFMMAIGEYAVVKDRWGDKAVNYFVEPEYKALAKRIFPHTPEMLSFFSERLQYPYPWDKFDQVVVRDYVSGAMENTSAVIYGQFVQGDERYLEDYNGEDIVAHEMFHHWFGDLVTCESWSNLPLNESFATYGEYLWNEHKHGRYTADYKLNNDLRAYLNEARVNQKDLIRFNYGHREEMFDTHSYQKGGRILHMLRKYLGDEAFFEALALYLNQHAYTAVEVHDLRIAFEEISGEDLNWFFNQWFLSAGHPVLSSQWTYDSEGNQLTIHIQQEQKGGNIPEVFQLPITVGILDANKELHFKKLWMNERTQSFNLRMNAAPLLVNLDAKKELLAEISQPIDANNAALLYQYFPNYLSQYQALNLLKGANTEAGLKVLDDAVSHDFWHIRYTAIKQIQPLVQKDSIQTLSRLIELAEKDTESSVRAAAFEAIGKYYSNGFNEATFKKGVNDLSYKVVASAMSTYYTIDAPATLEKANQFENEKSNTLTNAIGRIYSKEGDEKYNDYFTTKIEEANNFGKYQLIQLYGEYLTKQSPEKIRTVLPQLNLWAKHDTWYVRYASILTMIGIKSSLEEQIESFASSTETESAKDEPIRTAIQEIDALMAGLKESEKNETVSKLLNKL